MPIRQPTQDPLAWWRRALADGRTPRHDGEPEPGFYTRRYRKGGPLVPVEIRLVQITDPETGELAEPERLEADQLGWPKDPFTMWTHLKPVTREEFDSLVERHRVDQRMGDLETPIDLGETPTRPTRGAQHA